MSPRLSGLVLGRTCVTSLPYSSQMWPETKKRCQLHANYLLKLQVWHESMEYWWRLELQVLKLELHGDYRTVSGLELLGIGTALVISELHED